MRTKLAATWAAVVILAGGAGCGGTADTPPPQAASPSTAVSAPASPTPSPTAPSKTEDAAALKQAVVTPADLGKPWVEPKKVSSSGKASEACPGKPSAAEKVTRVASVRRDLTEGSGQGVSIGTFQLSTLPTEDAADLRAAYAKDNKTCRTFTYNNQLFVVFSEEGPTTADNADELLMSRAERIYYDKAHKKLAYARHTLVARTGRVVTYVSYAFLTAKADPTAKDFSAAPRSSSTPSSPRSPRVQSTPEPGQLQSAAAAAVYGSPYRGSALRQAQGASPVQGASVRPRTPGLTRPPERSGASWRCGAG